MKKFMLLCAAVLFSVAGLDAQQRPGNGYGHEGRPQQEGQMRQGAPQGGARGGKGMKGRGRRPAPKVDAMDTTGCGDAFFSGVAIGLTYGKTLEEACAIGTRLAASVIVTDENVCPRFQPAEFGIDVEKE